MSDFDARSFRGGAGLGDEAVAAAPNAPPHFRQKLASAGFAVSQEEQRRSTLVPHFMQNSASAGLSYSQDGQRIGSPVAPVTTTPCADGGRSMVLFEQAVEWSNHGAR